MPGEIVNGRPEFAWCERATPADYAGTPADYMLETRGIPREQFEQMTEQVTAIAADVGLDRSEVLATLSSNEFAPAVVADIALARDYGIQGVPFFVFDNKYGVSGAQEAATFTGVLEQVRQERDAA